MTIRFFLFERIWCWIVGHHWCRCDTCQAGYYGAYCTRCPARGPVTPYKYEGWSKGGRDLEGATYQDEKGITWTVGKSVKW